MACCCKNMKTKRASTICLGRCDLPKHTCLPKHIIKPGLIPKQYGWLYNARNAPHHQLRCGWRPGHISCSVLRIIEQYYNRKSTDCKRCPSVCSKCSKTCPHALKTPRDPSSLSPQRETQPMIRITRHGGQYSICTKPSYITNAPSGPYPLKYVLNTQDETTNPKANARTVFSVEAKYNNYRFDYTTSNMSFVLDFTPSE